MSQAVDNDDAWIDNPQAEVDETDESPLSVSNLLTIDLHPNAMKRRLVFGQRRIRSLEMAMRGDAPSSSSSSSSTTTTTTAQQRRGATIIDCDPDEWLHFKHATDNFIAFGDAVKTWRWMRHLDDLVAGTAPSTQSTSSDGDGDADADADADGQADDDITPARAPSPTTTTTTTTTTKTNDTPPPSPVLDDE